jgi:hypothetical protein
MQKQPQRQKKRRHKMPLQHQLKPLQKSRHLHLLHNFMRPLGRAVLT